MEEFIDFGNIVSIWNLEFIRGHLPKADLAAKYALSFPLTPMWLRIQPIRISLQFDIDSSLLKQFNDKRVLQFFLFNDSKTENKSENMINF